MARANLALWTSRAPAGALLEWQNLLERASVAELVALLRTLKSARACANRAPSQAC